MQQTTNGFNDFFRQISTDDKRAFDALFRLHYENLAGFAKNYLMDTGKAEEIVSDVFVALWLQRKSLANIENPQTYLFVAVKNRCLNALRSTAKIVSINDYPAAEKSITENPLSDMEQKELSQKLHTVVDALPEQQRLVFNMIKENELTAKQTAEILQLSPRTVETHLYKAIKQLEKEITEYLGYSPKKKQMGKMMMLAL